MTLVLDSSVFFTEFPVMEEAATPPAVVAELKDLRSKCKFEVLSAAGLVVREPSEESRVAVREAAGKTGDLSVLSVTDLDVLALAFEMQASIATDDFAIENTAHRLKLDVRTVQQRKAKPRRWKFRCSGCGRFYHAPGICDVCGAEIKRKIK